MGNKMCKRGKRNSNQDAHKKNKPDYKIPSELQNEKMNIWTWENLEKFIKQL